MMIELWLGIILLSIIAVSFLCWPLFVGKIATVHDDVDRQQENIRLFKQRLAELQQELDQNLLNSESFAELKLELEKNLLSDTSETVAKKQSGTVKFTKPQILIVIALCISLPFLSLAVYAKYGSAEELLWSENKNQLQQLVTGDKPTPAQAISLLEEELVRNPDNAEGWYMLAGAYMGANQYTKGATAFEKVLVYLPRQAPVYPQVLGQYAQALFFVGNKVTPEVRIQIKRALAIDANEVVSLGLLGIEAFELQQYQAAINFWEQSLANADNDAAQALKSGIAQAEMKILASGGVINRQQNDVNNKLNVIVDVHFTDVLQQGLPKDTVVFVFARPVGGKIPLAAVKLSVSDLPKRVVLNDSLAMMPTAKISLQKKVEVSARISISGRPIAQKGDYESAVVILDVSAIAKPVKLLINKVVE
jgi:cytochrome c-type biogenesis protein CcmH